MADTAAAGGGFGPSGDFLEDKRDLQLRMRHVQQFLASPTFLDMKEQPVTISDPPEVVEARKASLDYRIRVVRSVLQVMLEERDLLDRARPTGGDPADDRGSRQE